MNRLTLILFTQIPYFLCDKLEKKWCEYEYPSERDLIGFTLQCKRYVAQARHDDGITFFFYSIIIFLPLHFILFKRYFIIWLNVILFKECPTKVPANIWKMQNDCYNVGWKGYPKWYAFSKRKLKRLGQRAIYRCACNSFFCLLSVAFCLHISTTCHLEFFLKTWKHRFMWHSYCCLTIRTAFDCCSLIVIVFIFISSGCKVSMQKSIPSLTIESNVHQLRIWFVYRSYDGKLAYKINLLLKK